jgi:hypothetical protein
MNLAENLSFLQTLPVGVKVSISMAFLFIFAAILWFMWTPPQITQQKNTISESPPARIEQHTEGANSPAIQGVEGGLNLTIDQNKSEKATKEK